MDSPTPSPHLLTLPREIRNQIYSYLHRSLELRAIERIGRSQVFVKLFSVPYPSVYRVHPRLSAEFQESGPINNLSVLVFNRSHGDDKKYWHTETETVRRDNLALTHIKSVTLRFAPNSDTKGADPTNLLNALASEAKALRTIRIAECAIICIVHGERPSEDVNWTTHDKIPPLPHVLTSLPLVQRVNCVWTTTELWSEPELATCERHLVYQCRTHLYSTRRSDKGLWTAVEVMCSDQPRGYRKWREQAFKEWMAKSTLKSGRVIVWKEEDCAERSGDGSIEKAQE